MQVHHGCWVGTSFLFIGGRKPTYVGFLLESTRKGHLIPGAVVFSIRRSRIFHYKFFSLKNPSPSDNRRGGRMAHLSLTEFIVGCVELDQFRLFDFHIHTPCDMYVELYGPFVSR